MRARDGGRALAASWPRGGPLLAAARMGTAERRCAGCGVPAAAGELRRAGGGRPARRDRAGRRARRSWRAAGRVAVAMSGGVDSAVALLKAVEAGCEPVGVTLRLWIDPDAPDGERACCSPGSVRAARDACHATGVPHLAVDLREPSVTRWWSPSWRPPGRHDAQPMRALQRQLPLRLRCWPWPGGSAQPAGDRSLRADRAARGPSAGGPGRRSGQGPVLHAGGARAGAAGRGSGSRSASSARPRRGTRRGRRAGGGGARGRARRSASSAEATIALRQRHGGGGRPGRSCTRTAAGSDAMAASIASRPGSGRGWASAARGAAVRARDRCRSGRVVAGPRGGLRGGACRCARESCTPVSSGWRPSCATGRCGRGPRTAGRGRLRAGARRSRLRRRARTGGGAV